MSEQTETTSEDKILDLVGFLGSENMPFVSRLRLEPRGRTIGNLAGDHKSPETGEGYEFAVHRQYVPGDEIRRLDWKVWGRSDRLFVKRYEKYTELRGLICLDASGSMGFNGDPDGKGMSKYEFGCKLAAALAFILLQQGDAVSLVILGSDIRFDLPPSSSPTQITRILHALQTVRPEDVQPGTEDPPMSDLLHTLADRYNHKEFLVFISDLMEDPEQLDNVLGHFRHGKHDGLLLHLFDPMELNFPFRGWMHFMSLEAKGDQLLLESSSFRKAYLEALIRYIREIRRSCLLYGFDYMICRTHRHWRDVLLDALTKHRFATR